MLRYSILRLLIFLACLLGFWLLGLRGEANLAYLVIAAALTSMVLSYFLLRPLREQFSDQVAERVEGHLQAKREKQGPESARGGVDEAAEDAEIDDTFR